VLLLGAEFDSLTLLHYAENLARVSPKPVVRYRAPMLVDGRSTWVEMEEFDSNQPVGDWRGESYFELIPRAFLASGKGASGKVGSAQSCLLDANDLKEFAVAWLESHLSR
jgi:aminoglycoside 3-N-acetyltransferase